MKIVRIIVFPGGKGISNDYFGRERRQLRRVDGLQVEDHEKVAEICCLLSAIFYLLLATFKIILAEK